MKIRNLFKTIKSIHPDIKEWDHIALQVEFGTDTADKIQASIVCETTQEPWESWRVFEKVAVLINNREMIGDIIQDVDARELGYAVHVLKQEYPDERFNDEVCKYMAQILLDWGFVIAPPTLEFVQPFLPLIKLSEPQLKVQRAYLQEVEDYIKLMEQADSIKK